MKEKLNRRTVKILGGYGEKTQSVIVALGAEVTEKRRQLKDGALEKYDEALYRLASFTGLGRGKHPRYPYPNDAELVAKAKELYANGTAKNTHRAATMVTNGPTYEKHRSNARRIDEALKKALKSEE